MLKMLDERTARLDQERACGEKATNHDELKKCRPELPWAGRYIAAPDSSGLRRQAG